MVDGFPSEPTEETFLENVEQDWVKKRFDRLKEGLKQITAPGSTSWG